MRQTLWKTRNDETYTNFQNRAYQNSVATEVPVRSIVRSDVAVILAKVVWVGGAIAADSRNGVSFLQK